MVADRVADELLSATIYWERGRLVPDDRVADNSTYATHISGTRRPLSQYMVADNGSSATHKKTMSPAVADGGRWWQINPSICNRAKRLINNWLGSIFRVRLQICR